MDTPCAVILGLFYLFGNIFAQDALPCECSEGNKYQCICVLTAWCTEDNVIREDAEIDVLGDILGDIGFVKCQSTEKCCRIPLSFYTPNPVKCGGIVISNKTFTDNTTVIEKNDYPWLMEILVKHKGLYTHKCWGSLIHPEVVLTATHCLKTINPESMKGDEIKILSNIITSDDHNHEDLERQEKFAIKIISHSPYAPFSLINDVSLILLNGPMSLNEFVQTICLPSLNHQFQENQKCLIVGWETADLRIKILEKVEVQPIERSKCENLLRRTALGPEFDLHKSFVCVEGKNCRKVGLGNGGSPLTCDYGTGSAYQMGLVSWGVDNTCNTTENVPLVHVNVPIFVDWIKDSLKNHNIYL